MLGDGSGAVFCGWGVVVVVVVVDVVAADGCCLLIPDDVEGDALKEEHPLK